MAADDDMFVVIVEDDENDETHGKEASGLEIKIKEEVVDWDVPVENIIEQASKHGQQLVMDLSDTIKEEPVEDEEYLEDFENICDSESDTTPPMYYPHTDDEEDNLKKPKRDLLVARNERHRYSMLTPSEQKSFVGELRQDYPDLAEDEGLLVDCLYEIMKTVKPPSPPRDYYIMNDVMLECVICGSMSETIPAAGRHYQEKHGPRYLICFSCGVDFRSTTNLYKHEKRCVNPDARIVLKARALYLSRRCRETPHMGKSTRPTATASKVVDNKEKEKFRCDLCPAVFLAKVHLMSHINLHEGRRPFKCNTCEAAYTSHAALKRHQKKHSDLKFICGTCGHVFKAKPALISHMDTHRAEKKFGCSECSKRYATRFALKLHVDRVHRLLPPPCACQICPKRYARMSLLKEHMRKEHDMLLITRKMFFKSLPTLSKTQIEQQAKVVLKSEIENATAEFMEAQEDLLNQQNEEDFINGQNEKDFINGQNEKDFINKQNEVDFINGKNEEDFINEQNDQVFISEPKEEFEVKTELLPDLVQYLNSQHGAVKMIAVKNGDHYELVEAPDDGED